ncbi:hypothetical protein NCCP1664_00620 [Zafaria cholistanensis]|uniref:Uncharacterized protein n=1 Tax=Zafaria cholistanensis TaxID=1682741 RepID=A0A5A7NKX6_9MICC|nr:hypothetical protein [Zafaria cholistanensis]GER21565.1 hypothetical protein NCCP1664_00620 [Zafaria cholistanensis]
MSEHPTPETRGPASPRVPVGTLVFGSVAVVLGLLLLGGLLFELVLDPAYVAVGLLVLAGASMIIGGIAAGRRSRR